MAKKPSEDRDSPDLAPAGQDSLESGAPVGIDARSMDQDLSSVEPAAEDSEEEDAQGAEPLTEAESEALRAGIDQAFQDLAAADGSEEPPGPGETMSTEQTSQPSPGDDAPGLDLSDAEISQLVAQAAESAVSTSTPLDPVAPTAEEEAESPEPEEELEILSEDELADLVRGMIAAQGEELYGGPPDETISEEPAPFAQDDAPASPSQSAASQPLNAEPTGEASDDAAMSEEDIAALIAQTAALSPTPAPQEPQAAAEPVAEEVPEGILSASRLASLLGSKDPEGDLVPSESSQLDEDELAKLVSDAAQLEAGLQNQAVPSVESVEEPAPAEQGEAPSGTVAEADPAPSAPTGGAQSQVPDVGAVKAVPSHLAIRALALPVRFQDGKILCRVAQPTDQAAIDRLSRETGLGVIVEPAPILEVVRGLRENYAEVQGDSAHLAVLAITPKKTDIFSVFRRSA